MAATSATFPITEYTGPYKHEWTNKWHKVGAGYQFFAKPLEFVVANDGRGFGWGDLDLDGRKTLYGRDNNWGAFHLAGLVQIDPKIVADEFILRRACGLVSVRDNYLRMFGVAGNRSCDMRRSRWTEFEKDNTAYVESLGSGPRIRLRELVTNAPWHTHDVYCIPCTGKGPINLILVTKNVNLIEVYFLRGRDIGEENRDIRSQLPGMHQFYSKMRVARFFGFFARLKNMWTGVCCD